MTSFDGVKRTLEGAHTFDLRPNQHPASDAERAQRMTDPGFGMVFSDHMARIGWSREKGWHDHRVEAFGPLALSPASAVLHYSQTVFEGVKAYRHADGSVWTFRPEANATRMQLSARRLALPELPVPDFLESLRALVSVDQAWVPGEEESSLYLRPFTFASESFVGVRSAREAEYLVIASTVGAYFSKGPLPVSIWVEEHYNRTGPGGTGSAKSGGNYAASLLPQDEAYAQGCEQVAFLDAAEHKYFEELGGMNICFVYSDGSVSTPDLDGMILDGVTRASLLTLLRDSGHQVREQRIALRDVLADIRAGRITEVFACGTAAVVAPISDLKGENFEVQIGNGQAGELTMGLRRQLTDIQYGRANDTHEWLMRLA